MFGISTAACLGCVCVVVVEAFRRNIRRHRHRLLLLLFSVQQSLHHVAAEARILDLLEKSFRFDVRRHHRPNEPIRDTPAPSRAGRVGLQELSQEVFKQHLIEALGQVEDHRVHQIILKPFILQFCSVGMKIGQLGEDFRRSQ